MVHCSEKGGEWYRRILEAAERFMVRWHENVAELTRQRRASVVGGVQGNGGRGVARSAVAVFVPRRRVSTET